jgi:hypothetical protein
MSIILTPKIYNIPSDILNYILELAGYHKYRNGKYITQLNKNDIIFNLLYNIPLVKDSRVDFTIKCERKRIWYDKVMVIGFTEEMWYPDDFPYECYRYYQCNWYRVDKWANSVLLYNIEYKYIRI